MCSFTFNMTIIDTHVHLDHLDHIEGVLKNACESGVEAVVTVGVDLAANKKNLELKRSTQRPKIYVALGIHPGNIKTEEVDEGIQFIRDHVREAKAIGEIGLDFWYKWVKKDQQKKDEQRRVFHRQLRLAQEFDLPAVIHSRGAWRECFEAAKEEKIKRAVFHWYSGPLDVLKDIVSNGYFLSATPSLAYSPQSREAISHAPIEHTLIETDSPVYFGTEGSDGFQAEPKDVFRTLKAYCALKNMEEEKALEIFNRNAKEFFSLD